MGVCGGGWVHKWPSIPDDKQCEINRGYDVVKPPRAAVQQWNSTQSAPFRALPPSFCTAGFARASLFTTEQHTTSPTQCGRRSDLSAGIMKLPRIARSKFAPLSSLCHWRVYDSPCGRRPHPGVFYISPATSLRYSSAGSLGTEVDTTLPIL